jgi:uncharacterized protein YciI
MKHFRILSAAALLAAAATLATIAAAGPEEYEMSTYQVAFYRKGPAWTPSTTPEHQKLQSEHLAHIGKMADTGKLILAGPFSDGGDLRGMLIFRVDTPEEAKTFAEQDPAVKAGRLVLEWHPWFAAKNITVTPKSLAPVSSPAGRGGL